MESLIWAGLSVILLVPLLYFLPIGLKVSGKFILIVVAFLLASIGLLAKSMLPVWQAGLIVVVLACLVGYLLDTRLGKLFYLAPSSLPNLDFLVVEESQIASQENSDEQDSAEHQIEMGLDEAGASGERDDLSKTEEDIRLDIQRETKEHEEGLSEPTFELAESEISDVQETSADDLLTIEEWSVAPDSSIVVEAKLTEESVPLEKQQEQAVDEEADLYIAEVVLMEADILPNVEQEMSHDQVLDVEEQIKNVVGKELVNEETSDEDTDDDMAFLMNREQVATLLPETEEPISGHQDVQFEATHYMSEIEKMLAEDDSELDLGVITEQTQQAVSPAASVDDDTIVHAIPNEIGNEFELAEIIFDDAHIEADPSQVENSQPKMFWDDDEIEPLQLTKLVVEEKP